MSSNLAINGNNKHSSSASNIIKEIHQEEKWQDIKSSVRALISQIPPMRKLEKCINHYYDKLHQDELLPEFAEFFKEVYEANVELLQKFSQQEQANILFDYYRSITTKELEKTEEFSQACQELYTFMRVDELAQFYFNPQDEMTKKALAQKFSKLIDKYIYKECLKLVKVYHSCLLEFAIVRGLSANSDKIKSSSFPTGKYKAPMINPSKTPLFDLLASSTKPVHLPPKGI